MTTLRPRGVEVALEGYRIDSGGRFGVVWQDYRGPPGVVLGRFAIRGRLGGARTIDRDAAGLALAYVRGRPRVLMLAYGHRHARLVERSGDRATRRFGPRTIVTRRLSAGPDIAVAVNERGDEAVAWWADVERRSKPVHAGTRKPGEPLRAHDVGRTDAQLTAPKVAIAPTGAAAVAWPSRGNPWEPLLATAAGAGHRFGRAHFVVRPRHRQYLGDDTIELGVDSRSRAAIAWVTQRDGPPVLHAAVTTARGITRHRARLARGANLLVSTQGTAAVDGGVATIAWIDGHHVRTGHVLIER